MRPELAPGSPRPTTLSLSFNFRRRHNFRRHIGSWRSLAGYFCDAACPTAPYRPRRHQRSGMLDPAMKTESTEFKHKTSRPADRGHSRSVSDKKLRERLSEKNGGDRCPKHDRSTENQCETGAVRITSLTVPGRNQCLKAISGDRLISSFFHARGDWAS